MQRDDKHKARFLALLQSHRGLLYKVSRTYGRTATERADLAQEIVANLWRAYPRYDDSRCSG